MFDTQHPNLRSRRIKSSRPSLIQGKPGLCETQGGRKEAKKGVEEARRRKGERKIPHNQSSGPLIFLSLYITVIGPLLG